MLKNLIIAGFMLSGKSSVGELLSKKLYFNFIDTDKLVEKKENKSISDIFKYKGEKYFRDIEYKILKEIMYSKNNVISLGGGTFCSYRNINLIKKIGVSIFLDSDIDEIIKRANVDEIIKRPLFNKDFISLFYKRRKYYNYANIKIITKEKSIEDICSEIIEKINKIK